MNFEQFNSAETKYNILWRKKQNSDIQQLNIHDAHKWKLIPRYAKKQKNCNT
jgi:hypothetical protein